MSKQEIVNRRDFLQKTAAAALAAGSALHHAPAMAQPRGERPAGDGEPFFCAELFILNENGVVVAGYFRYIDRF